MIKKDALRFFPLLLLLLLGCGGGESKFGEATIILGREIGKKSGQSVVADTTSRFHINDIFNIEVIEPKGFRSSELFLKIYRVEDEKGRQLGTEFLSRSQTFKGIDPKGTQLVINNSAKQRTVARFIGPHFGLYRLEIHTNQYKIAEKTFGVYPKSAE